MRTGFASRVTSCRCAASFITTIERNCRAGWPHSSATPPRKPRISSPPPGGQLARADRLRLMGWPAPFAALLHVLFVKRCILDGWPGWYYALQRLFAETLLALEILDRRHRCDRIPAEAAAGGSGSRDGDNGPPTRMRPARQSGRRENDHSRAQRVPRRQRRLPRAGRKTRRGGRGGAVPPCQALGRISVASDRVLPARSRIAPRRCRPHRGQPEQRGAIVAQARLSRDRPSQSRSCARAAQESARPRPAPGSSRRLVPRRPAAREMAQYRTSSGAFILGLSRFAVRRGGRRLARRLRRFRQRGVGDRVGTPRSGSTAASFSRIRSASSIRR